jgi:16S rRNA (guanine(966)-N(2))-methyltransferase RsmD
VRIIAGAVEGAPDRVAAWGRPAATSDRLRETLFNVLAPRQRGCARARRFAGTGALGFEALSRGAAMWSSWTPDLRATAAIARTAAAWSVGQGYTIHVGDAMEWLRRLAPGPRFDLILLDPPYSLPQLRDALDAAAGCLSESGVLVLERATRREPDDVRSLERVRDLRAGDSTLTFYRRASAVEEG